MSAFRVELVMRYTRISCRPFRATFPASRFVQAEDAEDAMRQACLCIDRDLEEILSKVNAINVSEVLVEFARVEPAGDDASEFWNPSWFPRELTVPPYVIVQRFGEMES